MGIAKTVEFNNTGIELNYWRMNFVGVDIESNTAKIRVGGYLSKTDALAGKKAVENIKYHFVGSDNPITLMTDPNDYRGLLETKLIGVIGGGLISNKLQGGTIVSDMPDEE